MRYYVITCSEDGDVSVREFKQDELERRLADGWYENVDWSDEPPNIDPQYWRGRGLLIRGETVRPHPAEKVTKWKVP